MQVELQLSAADPLSLERRAERAEAVGADAVVSAETTHDAFLPLMIAARATRHVRLATGIVVAFPRSPMVTAMQSWYLHAYSQGRFELGLGSQVKGHIQRRYSTDWVPPGPRMRDYLGSLRAIWSSWQSRIPLHFTSSHYNFTLSTSSPPPPLPYQPIPLSIAAVNPYMLRLAGELCEGVRLHNFCSRRYLEEYVRPEVERGVAKRTVASPIEVSGGVMIATGMDADQVKRAREQARRSVSFYGSTRTYFRNFTVYGWDEIGPQLHELSLKGAWDEMPKIVPDEVLDEFVIAAGYEELPHRLQARLGGLVNRLSLDLPLDTNEEVDAARRLIDRLKSVVEAYGDGG